MKSHGFLLVIGILLHSMALSGQDRGKELDSLIERANALPDSEEKAQVLARIHERMMFMDNERAFAFAREAFELSKTIDFPKGIANGYLQFGNYHYNQSRNDSALFYHEKALELFRVIGSIRGQIFALHSMASIEKEQGNLDRALETTRSILAMYTEENRKNTDLGSYDKRGSEYEMLGGIYFEKGNYRLALEHTLTAVRLHEESGDEVRKGDALKQLADIEYELDNFTSSLKYALEAMDIYDRNGDKIYASYAGNTAGLAAEQLGQLDSARTYLERSLEQARDMNVQGMIGPNLKDLARLLYKEGEYATAESMIGESITIARDNGLKLDLSAALLERAKLYLHQGSYRKALRDIDVVIDISSEIQALATLSMALRTRAQILEKLGQYPAAYKDFERFHQLNDSVYDLEKRRQMEEMRTIYETERREADIALKQEEIRTLHERARVDKLTRGLYAGGMFTFLAISGLMYFGFTQRMKRNRIEREKQEELYRREIEFKQKELASQTLHLVQKNTFIQELLSNLESIKNSPDKFRVEFRRIVMLLKKENAADKDWEVFKTYFSEVHNDFDQKLRTLYPDISEKEIRLAAFLRMNLTTKEIAATLHVLPDSILKSKYRLKKKLGLSKETDLGTFLSAI